MSDRHPDPANYTRNGDEIHPWDSDLHTYAVHCTVCGEYLDDSTFFPGVDFVGECCDTGEVAGRV